MSKIFVYVAEYCGEDIKPLSVKFRNDEIKNVQNAELKKQKYSAFKLLEVGLWDGFRLKIDEIGLRKEGAKLISDKVKISLSHCDGFVAVAISQNVVGVDIERLEKERKHAVKKVFTEREIERYLTLSDSDKEIFYIAQWTKKESIFKRSDEKIFLPNNIPTENQCVSSYIYPQKNLVLSVAKSEEQDQAMLFWYDWLSKSVCDEIVRKL